MADPLSPGPIVSDDLVEAALVRLLRIRGKIGALAVSDVIVPTVSLGQTVPLDVTLQQPSFRSTDVFGGNTQVAPAAGAVLADTGALPAGIYDVMYYVATADTLGTRALEFEHRNAANAANLAAWDHLFFEAALNTVRHYGPFVFSYELATNERLRIVVGVVAIAAGVPAVATIFARIRA